MSRRPRRQAIDLVQHTLQQLEELARFSPNRGLCKELKSTLDIVLLDAEKGTLSAADASAFVTEVNKVLVALPRFAKERFWFDAAMIGTIRRSWSINGDRLSSTILPRYDADEWEHGRVPMPTRKRGEDDSVSFINFPGGLGLDGIELWDYAFLCHELGHNLLYYSEDAFTDEFMAALDRRTAELALAGIADRGQARVKGQQTVDKIRQVWRPVNNHQDWAHEMMMDIIALWACGPAYIASFVYEAGHSAKNPYQITQDHPPYSLRAEALAFASEELGWKEFARKLKGQQDLWRDSAWKSSLGNKYYKLADSKIMNACVSSALNGCAELNLPKCDATQLARVGETIRQGETPDFGTDLIVAAWMVREVSNESSYHDWERGTVATLFDRIMSQAT